MKITKQHLKQIIKEELENALAETQDLKVVMYTGAPVKGYPVKENPAISLNQFAGDLQHKKTMSVHVLKKWLKKNLPQEEELISKISPDGKLMVLYLK